MSTEENKQTVNPMLAGLGVTKDTKAQNSISVLPPTKLKEPTPTFPSGFKFPLVKLVNVIAKPDFDTKNGKTNILQFVFRDDEGRQHIHTEWEIDPTKEDIEKKVEGLNVRIKHIYTEVFTAFPEGGIGQNPKSFIDFFQKIEVAFRENAEGMSKNPLFCKLTYFNGNLNFPLSPNFLQRYEKDKPCKLEITLAGKYKDHIVPEEGGSANIPNIPAMGGGAMPSFDNEFK